MNGFNINNGMLFVEKKYKNPTFILICGTPTRSVLHTPIAFTVHPFVGGVKALAETKTHVNKSIATLKYYRHLYVFYEKLK